MLDERLIRIALGLARTMDPTVACRVNGLCNAYVLLAPLASAAADSGNDPTRSDWVRMFSATETRIRYFIKSGNLARGKNSDPVMDGLQQVPRAKFNPSREGAQGAPRRPRGPRKSRRAGAASKPNS
jgi:hypothetical protein